MSVLYDIPDMTVIVANKCGKKVTKTAKNSSMHLLLSDINTNARVRHPNILSSDSQEMVLSPSKTITSMKQTMDKGICDVNRLYKSGQMTVTRFWTIFHDLISALQAFHHAKIVHCDIKPENIILFPDGNFRLADHGLSFQTTGTRTPFTRHFVRQTYRYRAPEMIWTDDNDQPKYLDTSLDIWAFAVTMCELLMLRQYGVMLDNGIEDEVANYAIMKEKALSVKVPHPGSWNLKIAPEDTNALYNILTRCLLIDPASRMTASNIVHSQLFNDKFGQTHITAQWTIHDSYAISTIGDAEGRARVWDFCTQQIMGKEKYLNPMKIRALVCACDLVVRLRTLELNQNFFYETAAIKMACAICGSLSSDLECLDGPPYDRLHTYVEQIHTIFKGLIYIPNTFVFIPEFIPEEEEKDIKSLAVYRSRWIDGNHQ